MNPTLKGFFTVHWLPGALALATNFTAATGAAVAAGVVHGSARTHHTDGDKDRQCLLDPDHELSPLEQRHEPAGHLSWSPTGTDPKIRLTVKSASVVNASERPVGPDRPGP